MAMEDTRITARLPHLDIEIRQRELPDDNGEELTIRVQATPSFNAVSTTFLPAMSAVAAMNPALIWMHVIQQAWQPWLRMMALPSVDKSDN